jgi:hypothetical protein
MQITIAYDEDRSIPVPVLPVAERATWAEQTAAAFAARVGGGDQLRQGVASALDRLTVLADDDSRLLLLIGADGAMLAPLLLFVVPHELDEREQADFLWQPSALLPPTPTVVTTTHLGTGFSSGLAQREDGADFSTRRWLFFGSGMTVAALLGPVAPLGLGLVEAIADALLAESWVEGFVPREDVAKAQRLDALASPAQEGWRLGAASGGATAG